MIGRPALNDKPPPPPSPAATWRAGWTRSVAAVPVAVEYVPALPVALGCEDVTALLTLPFWIGATGAGLVDRAGAGCVGVEGFPAVPLGTRAPRYGSTTAPRVLASSASSAASSAAKSDGSMTSCGPPPLGSSPFWR